MTPPSLDEIQARAKAFNARLDELLAKPAPTDAERAEVMAIFTEVQEIVGLLKAIRQIKKEN